MSSIIQCNVLPSKHDIQQYRNAEHLAKNGAGVKSLMTRGTCDANTWYAVNALAVLVHYAHPAASRTVIGAAIKNEFNVVCTEGQIRDMIEPNRLTGGGKVRSQLLANAKRLRVVDENNDGADYDEDDNINANTNYNNNNNDNTANSTLDDDENHGLGVNRSTSSATATVTKSSSVTSATSRRANRCIALTGGEILSPNDEYSFYVEAVSVRVCECARFATRC